MKEIILDTETTGLSVKDGHRIVEIGCIELDNQILTSNRFHCYLNPQRKVSEEAFKVHGYSDKFLSDKKKFSDIADDFIKFIADKKLIIHNAQFDLSHLNNELKILGKKPIKKDQVIDTEIKNITEFGIFAKLNDNIDGLIHKNDLSWTDSNGDRTLKKYQKGQNIQVKILEIDPEKEKISFGIKQLTPDPFHEFFKDKNKGDIVSATITKINNNGIDVEVANFI